MSHKEDNEARNDDTVSHTEAYIARNDGTILHGR